MDQARILRECNALTATSQAIDYDLNVGVIALEAVTLPPGWNRDRTTLVFKLPPTYPREQPDVYMPDELRYHGRLPMIMLQSDLDGWSKHCIHNFSDRWVPEWHTMVTMLRMVKASLNHPNKKDPWVDYE